MTKKSPHAPVQPNWGVDYFEIEKSVEVNNTFLSIHEKREWAGINETGVLPFYHGIIVHDCWGSYWKYENVIHSICCAHLLRELNGVEENHPEQTWATRFKELLVSMKKAKESAMASGKGQ